MKVGKIVDRRDQVLIAFLSPRAFMSSTFFKSLGSAYGPFFKERAIYLSRNRNSEVGIQKEGQPRPFFRLPSSDFRLLFRSALADNELGGRLIAPGFVTKSRFAPRGRGTLLAANGRFTLAAPVRMVPRVHGDSANAASLAHPTGLAGFAPRFVL